MKKFIVVLLIGGLLSGTGFGYGPRGHALVGAIADKRIAKSNNSTVKANLKTLLDGLTLQQAATLPDSIKTWDKNPNGFHVAGHPSIEAQLRAFVKANPAGGHPSHHDFHFTDVPVLGDESYAPGDVGRSDFDIVHMIPFCIRVLKGEEPETNDRAITKAIAVILLTHYLGDIHQPLHVGAEYFDGQGNLLEPTTANPGFADQGGNKLTVFTFVKGKLKSAGKFHGYWDSQTVTNAFGDFADPKKQAIADSKSAQQLANKEPANWKLTTPVENWAEDMANEIMPMAREAHDRLNFTKIKSTPGERDITSGRGEEKKKSSGKFYATWARDTVKKEIHKAGWRLAALLEEVLQ